MESIQFKIEGLFLPMRTTFRQASSTRNRGESIWCEATRGNFKGYGEGCPRFYVTKETVDTGLIWLKKILPEITGHCNSLDSLKNWMSSNREEIDKKPAAFCAVEIALLDLFAKERNISVEALVGLNEPAGSYQYSAILGSDSKTKFINQAERYFSMGFSDFKIKTIGNLVQDQKRLEILHSLAAKNNISNIRIRFDANNLWSGNSDEVIEHFSKLNFPILGIEEPVEPKNYKTQSEISKALNIPIILDESLCSLSDLHILDDFPGEFIINIKVSRVGGVIRTLELIQALKKRNRQIIIGGHVGETSVLTRAGILAAKASGYRLIAQEGAFGLILLEKEPIEPSLSFGKGGKMEIGEKALQLQGAGWGLRKNRNY